MHMLEALSKSNIGQASLEITRKAMRDPRLRFIAYATKFGVSVTVVMNNRQCVREARLDEYAGLLGWEPIQG